MRLEMDLKISNFMCFFPAYASFLLTYAYWGKSIYFYGNLCEINVPAKLLPSLIFQSWICLKYVLPAVDLESPRDSELV